MRPFYQPGATITPELGVTFRYGLQQRTNGVLIMRNEWLDSDVRNSPIIVDDRRWSAVFGVTRRLWSIQPWIPATQQAAVSAEYRVLSEFQGIVDVRLA